MWMKTLKFNGRKGLSCIVEIWIKREHLHVFKWIPCYISLKRTKKCLFFGIIQNRRKRSLKLFNLKSMVFSIFLYFNCICRHSRQFQSHFREVLAINHTWFLIVMAWNIFSNIITHSKNLAVVTSNNSLKQRKPFIFSQQR